MSVTSLHYVRAGSQIFVPVTKGASSNKVSASFATRSAPTPHLTRHALHAVPYTQCLTRHALHAVPYTQRSLVLDVRAMPVPSTHLSVHSLSAIGALHSLRVPLLRRALSVPLLRRALSVRALQVNSPVTDVEARANRAPSSPSTASQLAALRAKVGALESMAREINGEITTMASRPGFLDSYDA